jgi:hypothetical protein
MPKPTASKTTAASKEPAKKTIEPEKTVEVKTRKLTFRCKFCDTEKPIEDMVMLRQYYPPKAACKDCARVV